MVDCRPAGAAHDLAAHAHANGSNAPPPPDNQHNAGTNGGVEPGSGASSATGGSVASSSSGRAGTPHAISAAAASAATSLTAYTGGMSGTSGMQGGYMGGGGAAYMCGAGVKSMVWCAPHSPPHLPPPAHAPPPPPPPVNLHVYKSVQANGADLPMNDIPTLRYYFNLGVDCMWASYGPPPPPPPPPAAPPRHYSQRDLSQDIQQLSLHERGAPSHAPEGPKHKPPGDKPPINNQNKGNGQRPLLGPRFKRGNHQDGNQNKQYNNIGNKGPNNRRNMQLEGRMQQSPGMVYGTGGVGPEGECVMEPQLISLPYIPYPPPLYPVSYYPVESDPAMMGMMGYVGYEEGMEYGAPVHYYPAPAGPPPPPHHYPPAPPGPPPAHLAEHK